MWSLLRVICCLSASVFACAGASAEELHYYRGPHRVNLQLALDELDLVLAPGIDALGAAGAVPAKEWLADGRGRIESVGNTVVRYLGGPSQDAAALSRRAKMFSRRSEMVVSARPVCYGSKRDLASRNPLARYVLTPRFVALLSQGDDAARLARRWGVTLVEKLPVGRDLYVFETDDGLSALRTANRVFEDGQVRAAQPVLEFLISPRFPDDPLFSDEWHLRNTGQGGGTPGVDLNVESAWDDTYYGQGVKIAVVDDGLEIVHPDLAPNHDDSLAWDYSYGDADPSPACYQSHGTSVAGVAAARGLNGLGVSGTAPKATLVGVRLTAAYVSDTKAALALSHRNDVIDIYTNSWGPLDNGITLDGPGVGTAQAMLDSVTYGRGGLGCVYVWAAGNGGTSEDNTNYDGYANSRYTIAVTGSDNTGVHPDYAEPGACIMLNAPSSGGTLSITTTDLTGSCGSSPDDYRDDFGKTSAATPQVAGTVAMMLEANPGLGWRDVQHILVNTAMVTDEFDPSWATNGAGLEFSHQYGFGRADASAAVSAALTWSNVKVEGYAEVSESPGLAVPDDDPVGLSRTFVVTDDLSIESVEVSVSITTACRGDLHIELESPDGTVSVLAEARDDTNDDYDWTFTTVQHWNERSPETWTLRVKDLAAGNIATLNSWTLRIWGTRHCPGLHGDFDFDCDVDLVDFTRFADCYAGEGTTMPPGSCTAEEFDIADADDDGDVDLGDFITFASDYTGALY